MKNPEDIHTQLYKQPEYVFGKLLALERAVIAIGLMHATAPEVREEVRPAIELLLDVLTAEPCAEATLEGVRSVQARFQRLGRVEDEPF